MLQGHFLGRAGLLPGGARSERPADRERRLLVRHLSLSVMSHPSVGQCFKFEENNGFASRVLESTTCGEARPKQGIASLLRAFSK